jgi:hypothetical protein
LTNDSTLVDPIDLDKLVGSIPILEIPILIKEHGKDKGGSLLCISFIVVSILGRLSFVWFLLLKSHTNLGTLLLVVITKTMLIVASFFFGIF